MVDFKTVTGNLYVGESAEEAEHIDEDSQSYLYANAVFRSDDFSVSFYSGIGGYFPVKEEDIIGNVYYPYFNETVCDFEAVKQEELTLFKEDVKLEYAVVNDKIYVKSDVEVAAYGGFNLVQNDEIYNIHGSLLVESNGKSSSDEFLEMSEVENPVKVENVSTGVASFVSDGKVRELVKNDDKNGALEIREPENITRQVLRKIED